MCILFVYTLLKVVSYYDLSVFSMSMMGFPKKNWIGCELYPSIFWIFLTLRSPLIHSPDVAGPHNHCHCLLSEGCSKGYCNFHYVGSVTELPLLLRFLVQTILLVPPLLLPL